MIEVFILLADKISVFYLFGPEKLTGKLFGGCAVELPAGENIDVGLTPQIREMAGYGTCLYQLYQRIAFCVGRFCAKIRDKGFSVLLHPD